eukprot:2698605-Prymnesium_polylepis.1
MTKLVKSSRNIFIDTDSLTNESSAKSQSPVFLMGVTDCILFLFKLCSTCIGSLKRAAGWSNGILAGFSSSSSSSSLSEYA